MYQKKPPDCTKKKCTKKAPAQPPKCTKCLVHFAGSLGTFCARTGGFLVQSGGFFGIHHIFWSFCTLYYVCRIPPRHPSNHCMSLYLMSYCKKSSCICAQPFRKKCSKHALTFWHIVTNKKKTTERIQASRNSQFSSRNTVFKNNKPTQTHTHPCQTKQHRSKKCRQLQSVSARFLVNANK